MADPTFATTTALPDRVPVPDLGQPIPGTSTTVPAVTRPAANGHVNNHANGTTSHNTRLPEVPAHIAIVLPSGIHSLSGISLRSNLLGLALGFSSSLAIFLAHNSHPLWRASFFISCLSVFHFLEFYMTARYNTPLARIDAFLLSSNGKAYAAANIVALLEVLVAYWFGLYDRLLPDWSVRYLTLAGFCMIFLGQGARSVAMAHAGTNFNHTVQWRKNAGHQLVTGGIYGWLRHPSYFGYFWWALGTQVIMGNVMCFIAYTALLWKFFQMRIRTEEQYLVRFFGDDYSAYKKNTGVGIPFIS